MDKLFVESKWYYVRINSAIFERRIIRVEKSNHRY